MSGRSSQQRGKRAEVEVVHALERAGYRAMTSRAVRGGTQHGADLISDFPAVLEVKDHAKLDLPGFWRQAVDQSGDDVPGLIVKRRGFALAEDWWYVSDVRTQLRLIAILSGREAS
jgi:hypothetical protein